MFRPRDSHDLRLLQANLVIEPQAQVRWIHDPFGNSIAIASFGEEPVAALEFLSTSQLEHYGMPPDVPMIEDYARKLPFSYLAEEAPDLARYVERHYPDPNAAVSGWARHTPASLQAAACRTRSAWRTSASPECPCTCATARRRFGRHLRLQGTGVPSRSPLHWGRDSAARHSARGRAPPQRGS